VTGLLGYLGGNDPSEKLMSAGREPSWSAPTVAFSGTPTWCDESGDVLVAGDVILDNRDELRRSLGRPGDSDGQLLAGLIRKHGMAAGKYALGMFAVAAWDRRENRLLLLRDGVGGRTIYCAGSSSRGEWWFATRLRDLPLAARGGISLMALRDYLAYSYVPGDQTMWDGVTEIRPGTVVALPEGSVFCFWEPHESEWDPNEPIDGHAARLRVLLDEAVEERLPASGPVGVYLSGGLDSSLVTAIAARHAPGRIHTYSISFGPKYRNELEFSEMVAQHCGTTHRVLEVTPGMVRDHFRATMAALDDPIGDPLTVPNYLLAREASRDVGVVLNGEGGDPCFGGPKNQSMLLHALYSPLESPETAYLRSYRKCYTDLPRLLKREVQGALSCEARQEELLKPFFENSPMTHYLHRLMHLNIRLKGADHILTKVSNLTSEFGLVGRSPLFDRRVVDASLACPPSCKMQGIEEKVVLKRAVADLLPAAILARPKSGMMVPVNGWMKGELRSFVGKTLGISARPTYGLAGLVSRLVVPRRTRRGKGEPLIWEYLDRAVGQEWLSSGTDIRAGAKLWILMSLELWLQANVARTTR